LSYGLPLDIPTLFAAANFGVDEILFHVSDERIPGLVVYARKATPNCNYFGFVEAAIGLIKTTNATFVGIGLDKIQSEAKRRFGDYDDNRLHLIEEVDLDEFARLIRSADVVVSPAYTDGMPVTILGAVASGARIVAGELPQLQELVSLGVNIDLIDPRDSLQIAQAIERQLNSSTPFNSGVLPIEYSRSENLVRVREFYEKVLRTTEKRKPIHSTRQRPAASADK
jgi:glycosyltransferase involved in cell wall biosynthesis